MSVKILLMFVCTAIGTAVGYSVMRAYRRNLVYMDSMCAAINELKRNISYRRDAVSTVLSKCVLESEQLKKNIGEYISYVGAKDGKLEISRGFLSAAAYASVCEFFASLGKSDGSTQLNDLELFDSTFSAMRNAAAEKSSKYGALSVKLGFLFGLGVGVLIL